MTGPPPADEANGTPSQTVSGLRTSRLSDYLSLCKPRIVALLSLVAVCGLLVGAGSIASVPVGTGVGLLATGALAAGGSGALNNYHDRDIDPLMDRTRDRPIPDGRIPAWHALALGVVLSLAALVLGLRVLDVDALVWVGAGWLAYLGVYTLGLKRRSVWGVVLGGTAGSFAALAGLSTASGTIPVEGWVMAGLVAVWTLPHAWAQALVHVDDFRRAGVATLPARSNRSVTTRVIFATALATIAVAGSAGLFIGPVYGIGALAPLGVFGLAAHQLHREPSSENARFLFLISNVTLALLFLLWTLDAWTQAQEIWIGAGSLVASVALLDKIVFERLSAPDHPFLGIWERARETVLVDTTAGTN